MFEFSKGMKQKVVLAAALLHKPEVLFLDEPLDGLDANVAMVVKELLKRLAAQGRTVLFCSHILDVVERTARASSSSTAGARSPKAPPPSSSRRPARRRSSSPSIA